MVKEKSALYKETIEHVESYKWKGPYPSKIVKDLSELHNKSIDRFARLLKAVLDKTAI